MKVGASNGTLNAGAHNLFGSSEENAGTAFYSFTPSSTDIDATLGGAGGAATHIPTLLASILNATLANNGGPTQTLALVAGSPAIDAGTDTVTTDQRGALTVGLT